MANLTSIRAAMANTIQTYTNPVIQARAESPDTVEPPCAIVVPARNLGKYGVTLVGNPVTQSQLLAVTEFNLDIVVLVARAADINQVQNNLDQWLGFELDENVTSIPMALAIDPTLGGAVQFCEPMTVDSYGPVEWNGVTYFGARIHTIVSVV